MHKRCIAPAVALLALAAPFVTAAHETASPSPRIIVESDLGLDDAVALSLALQAPHLDLAELVTVPGAADADTAARAGAMLRDRFNRGDIPLTTILDAAETPDPAIAERLRSVWAPLVGDTEPPSPGDIAQRHDRPVTILALGPLTTTAARLRHHHHIDRIVIPGPPDPAANWNLRADSDAWNAIRTADVPVVHVLADVPKPGSWAHHPVAGDTRATSLAQQFIAELLADPDTRLHYVEALSTLHDELAVLYLARPDLFTAAGPNAVRVESDTVALDALADLARRGRQPKDRVVFTAAALPDSALRPDVRDRRTTIIANNGEDEWFAQLLLNELHEHLGAYSIIGVKMGLRAAEILNAPPHSMEIRSAAPERPPMSCLNDGLLVATGSTPGRGLFEHRAEDAVRATFQYNGRTVQLELNAAYRSRIATRIGALRSEHGLEHPGYWAGVRDLGLDIWQDWHRLDLFDVAPLNATGKETAP
jgi:inosine-uridine nucleoside N-ribohydrolase